MNLSTAQNRRAGRSWCQGCGNRLAAKRITPLTKDTVTTVKNWIKDRGGLPADPLFPTRSGTAITRDALERRVAKHAATAALACSTLAETTVETWLNRSAAPPSCKPSPDSH